MGIVTGKYKALSLPGATSFLSHVYFSPESQVAMHPLSNVNGQALVLALILTNAVANPLTSLSPKNHKRHDCVKPKVFIISMVIFD